ncbi:MAG: dihydrofolate reductase family protein [Clostridia bacterium]|nr:dihydrofolate reductase family protein [Clostridia bacterium]
MRTVTLFIAMSIDGFIADRDGGMDWLGGQDPDGEELSTYNQFIQGIDTVVMGWNTYEQVINQVKEAEWPYADMMTYVFTHRNPRARERICFINADVCEFLRGLKMQKGGGIWICGGAEIAQQLLQAGLIDVLHLNIMPTILGNGIRLFKEREDEVPLRLLKTQSYNGITDVVYTRRNQAEE